MTCMNAGNRTLTRAHRSTPHASKLIKIANKHMQSTWSDFIMNVYILLILFTDRRIFPDVSIERVPSSPIQGRRNWCRSFQVARWSSQSVQQKAIRLQRFETRYKSCPLWICDFSQDFSTKTQQIWGVLIKGLVDCVGLFLVYCHSCRLCVGWSFLDEAETVRWSFLSFVSFLNECCETWLDMN